MRRDQDDLTLGNGEIEIGCGKHLAESLRNRHSTGLETHTLSKIRLLGIVEEREFAILLDPGYGLRERNVRKFHVERRFLLLAIYDHFADCNQQQNDGD